MLVRIWILTRLEASGAVEEHARDAMLVLDDPEAHIVRARRRAVHHKFGRQVMIDRSHAASVPL